MPDTNEELRESAGNAVKFVSTRKLDSFESLAKFTVDKEQRYRQLEEVHLSKGQKLSRLKELSARESETERGRNLMKT